MPLNTAVLLLRRDAGRGGAAQHVLRRAGSSGATACASRSWWRWRTRRCRAGSRRCGPARARKYSWRGICDCATHDRLPATGRARSTTSPGPTAQRVCMKWNTLRERRTGSIGGYAEARDPTAAVNYLDSDPTFLSRWPWPVSARSATAGTTCRPRPTAFVDASQRLSNAEPPRDRLQRGRLLRGLPRQPRRRDPDASRAASATSGTSTRASMGEVTARLQAHDREAAHRRGARDRRVAARLRPS